MKESTARGLVYRIQSTRLNTQSNDRSVCKRTSLQAFQTAREGKATRKGKPRNRVVHKIHDGMISQPTQRVKYGTVYILNVVMISSTSIWPRNSTVKGNYSTAFHNLKGIVVNLVPALLRDYSKALTLSRWSCLKCSMTGSNMVKALAVLQRCFE